MNNNKNSENNIELSPTIKNNMDKVFTSAKSIVDALEDGKKIITKDLIDKVVCETELSSSVVAPYVDAFIHSYEAVKVEKGRGGGIYKGGRPKRIDSRKRCETCGTVLRNQNLDEEKE
jgi:hypothetical protein